MDNDYMNLPNDEGFFGEYGGKFVPETLMHALKELEKYNILIESLQPKINSSKMWDSWTTLRAKSIFEDTESMNLKNIEEMTYQAIWEYKKGANIKDNDIYCD